MFKTPEKYRVLKGRMASTEEDGCNGVFQYTVGAERFNILCSDGEKWEHVSVSKSKSGKIVIPTWIEMCKIKNLFWDLEDTVIEYHPALSDYVNRHPGCLRHRLPACHPYSESPLRSFQSHDSRRCS